MTSQKEIKSIPLSGGLQTDVGEFSLEPPSLAEVNGMHFVNQTEVTKCPTSVFQGALTGTAVTLTPYRKNDLAALLSDGSVDVWDVSAATKTNFTSKYLPHTVTRTASVPAKPNADDFSMYYYEGTDRIVCAWVERQPHDGTPTVKVESRDGTTGELLKAASYADRCSPKIAENGYVYYWKTDGTSFHYTNSEITGSGSITIPASAGPGHSFDAQYGFSGYNTNLRIGFSDPYEDYSINWAISKKAGQNGCLVYRNLSNDLRVCRMTGESTINGTSVHGWAEAWVLDVDVEDDSVGDAQATILFSTMSGAPTVQFLRAATHNIEGSLGTPAFTVINDGTGTDGHYVNGSVKRRYSVGGQEYFKYACTRINEDPDESRNAYPTISFGKVVNGVKTTFLSNGLRGWRLTSRINSLEASWDDISACISPFSVLEPYDTSDQDGQHYLLGSVQLGTTLLVNVKPSVDISVIAQVDPGESRAWLVGNAETNNHLTNLSYDPVYDDWFFGNRVLGANSDDASLVIDNVAGAGKENHQILYGGSWGMNYYRAVASSSSSYVTSSEFGDGFVASTNIPIQFDGLTVTEVQPLHAPEIMSLTFNSTIPTSCGWTPPRASATTEYRGYQLVYASQDSSGRIHRSPPSLPIYFRPGTPADANDVVLTVRSRVSIATEPDSYIEVYAGNFGEEFKLAATQRAGNVGYTTTITFADYFDTDGATPVGFPDRATPYVYTTGALASDAWPDMTDTTMTGSRWWGISEHNPGVLYFSKPLQPGFAPEYSLGNYIAMGRNKELTAINKIDDKVIVFESDAIYAVIGNGPDANGTNGDFIVDKLQTVLGTEHPQTVVETNDGLMFYSTISKEIHLLTRDLQIVDIGKPVSAYTRATNILPYQAVVVPGLSEVRFSLYDYNPAWAGEYGPNPATGLPATGVTRPPRPRFRHAENPGGLAYNYHYKKWSAVSHNNAMAACTLGAGYADAGFLGTGVNIYAPGTEGWGGRQGEIRSPWIRTNQLQGFGRLDEIILLGRYLSSFSDASGYIEAGDVYVKLYYDYESYDTSYVETFRFRANDGSMGPTNGRLQLAVKPGRPQCQAVQIVVQEGSTDPIDVTKETTAYTYGPWVAWTGADVIYSKATGTGRKSMSYESTK